VASVLKRALPKTQIILFTLFDEAIGNTLAAAIGVDLVLSKAEGTKAVGIRANGTETKRQRSICAECLKRHAWKTKLEK